MPLTHPARPGFSPDQARDIARTLYGIDGTVEELTSERDRNFRIADSAGRQFVLKIASRRESVEILESQNAVLAHLAASDESIACPRVCESMNGRRLVEVVSRQGVTHWARVLTHVPGTVLATFRPHHRDVFHALGAFLGTLDDALARFDHPGVHRHLPWDLRHASAVITERLPAIHDVSRRRIVESFLAEFHRGVEPRFSALRAGVIHNDANDHNVLVTGPDADGGFGIGLIDFGDIVHSCTVFEVAIAAAYVLLGEADPVGAACDVIRGYHSTHPLTQTELELLFNLICMRLCVSVAISAARPEEAADNAYLRVSEGPAWAALHTLKDTCPRLAHYRFRDACGLEPCPNGSIVAQWLAAHREVFSSVSGADLDSERVAVLDLSVASGDLRQPPDMTDPRELTDRVRDLMCEAEADVGIGRYGEARLVYATESFRPAVGGIRAWRTIHTGLDLFMAAGSPVYAPLDGFVHSFNDNAQPLDYGPTIILRHELDEGRVRFFTLYGHLSRESLIGLAEGSSVAAGERIGALGQYEENGHWPPHLHFQILCDDLDRRGDFPGVCSADERRVWMSVSPDPNLIVGVPEDRFPPPDPGAAAIADRRRDGIGPSLSVSYRDPLHIVRGWRQHLYDEWGRPYLDCVNNVCHVGHCHPHVVETAARQMSVLNTNTRYLHRYLTDYADRVRATLPNQLSVCYFVNSGSEANELALRMARAHTGGTDFIVVEGGYHGNTAGLVDVSSYKFDGPGGAGCPAHVHPVLVPDVYRGTMRDPGGAGAWYAKDVHRAVEESTARGGRIAAFLSESIMSCAGQIVLPVGYLTRAYEIARSAGAVCIADEVQVGFGRVGSHFWGFETQDVVPDIVTLGKPIGNGHPLGAVITTPEIAASFDNGMEYFNTFGGNPVSCAVGLAVLDVLEHEGLQESALRVGTYLRERLEGLQGRHRVIGDVRGVGLFIGVELVRNRDTLEPAANEASYLVERMKEEGVLLSTDGPFHNVLKIKPPLVFTATDADTLVDTLDAVLREDAFS